MPIQISEPIIIPASEEKVFDSFWIQKINIFAPNPKLNARVEIEVIPYNTTSLEVMRQPRRIILNDFFKELENNQKLALAMNSIIEAVDSLINPPEQT